MGTAKNFQHGMDSDAHALLELRAIQTEGVHVVSPQNVSPWKGGLGAILGPLWPCPTSTFMAELRHEKAGGPGTKNMLSGTAPVAAQLNALWCSCNTTRDQLFKVVIKTVDRHLCATMSHRTVRL